MIRDELQTVCNWIQNHVSEYSAFHYRQILLLKLKPVCDSFTECLVSELAMMNQLLITFPDRESLFLHRRFIVMSSAGTMTEKVTSEKKFIETQKQLARGNDWHLFLIERHEKWLANITAGRKSRISSDRN